MSLLPAGSHESYLRYVSPAWSIFSVFIRSMWLFCDAPHTNWGLLFTVGHRKRIVTGVTDRGSEFAMWWSGTASINLSVILSRRWSLNTGCHSGQPLFTQPWLCLWETLSSLSCLFGPLHSFTSFYLNFTSCPFSVYYFLTSSSGSQRRGEGGKHGKRCGIFFKFFFYISFLAPTASRHKALCPFLQGKRTPPHSHIHTLCTLPLKLPSSTSLRKATPLFPAKLFSLSFRPFNVPLLNVLLNSGNGGACLRAQVIKGEKWEGENTEVYV